MKTIMKVCNIFTKYLDANKIRFFYKHEYMSKIKIFSINKLKLNLESRT